MAIKLCLTWNNHMNLTNEFKNFLLSEDMVDVTLSCEGQTLKAHKLILSACSPFFRALFLENPNKHPIIIFNDVKYSDLKAIIEYIYFGEVKVAIENLSSLMKIAKTLKVKGLGELKSEGNRSDNESENQPIDSENQPMEESENQPMGESESQSVDESEYQLQDESIYQSADESDDQLEDASKNQLVDETVHESVLKVDLSNSRLTQEQLSIYKCGDGTHERQTEQEILDNVKITSKTQKKNSSYRNRKKQSPEQCADASLESLKNISPSVLKRILTESSMAKQSSTQSKIGQEQRSTDNSCSLVPVTPLFMSPGGSIVGCREVDDSSACKKVELKSILKNTFEKRQNSVRSDISNKSDSNSKKALKKTQNSESANGNVESNISESGSFEVQPFEAGDQTNPDLRQFNCSCCSFTTTTRKNLLLHTTLHRRSKCIIAEIYKCDMCPYTTSIRGYLMKHMRRKHKIYVKNCIKDTNCVLQTDEI